MPCTQKITAFPRSSRFSTYLSQRKTLTWIIAIESSPNMCLQTEAINSTDWRWHPATHTRAGRGGTYMNMTQTKALFWNTISRPCQYGSLTAVGSSTCLTKLDGLAASASTSGQSDRSAPKMMPALE